jgi:hypothetical protein
MSTRLLCTAILTIVLSAVALSYGSADEYTVEKDQWLHIPVYLPEKKAGGGEFYNLKFEPVKVKSTSDYVLLEEAVKIRFKEPGIYNYRLVVNRITKPSCAGVRIDEYTNREVLIRVVD